MNSLLRLTVAVCFVLLYMGGAMAFDYNQDYRNEVIVMPCLATKYVRNINYYTKNV